MPWLHENHERAWFETLSTIHLNSTSRVRWNCQLLVHVRTWEPSKLRKEDLDMRAFGDVNTFFNGGVREEPTLALVREQGIQENRKKRGNQVCKFGMMNQLTQQGLAAYLLVWRHRNGKLSDKYRKRACQGFVAYELWMIPALLVKNDGLFQFVWACHGQIRV